LVVEVNKALWPSRWSAPCYSYLIPTSYFHFNEAKVYLILGLFGQTNYPCQILPLIQFTGDNRSIVHFFSSVAHVWVPVAKTTGPIVKIWFFLNLIFMSVRILSFNTIQSVIKKMFHKGPVAANGACQKWQFYFWIFFNETWRICRWAWKNNNL
jgi:hypothetical protein